MLNVPVTAETWQTELGVNIDEDRWDGMGNHTRKISVCHRAGLLQYEILHPLQISSSKRHKMNPQISLMCSKCEISVGRWGLIHIVSGSVLKFEFIG